MDRDTADEVKRHFDDGAGGVRSEIRSVADGLQGLHDETTAEFKAIREKISETHAMIRLSFASSIVASARSKRT